MVASKRSPDIVARLRPCEAASDTMVIRLDIMRSTHTHKRLRLSRSTINTRQSLSHTGRSSKSEKSKNTRDGLIKCNQAPIRTLLKQVPNQMIQTRSESTKFWNSSPFCSLMRPHFESTPTFYFGLQASCMGNTRWMTICLFLHLH